MGLDITVTRSKSMLPTFRARKPGEMTAGFVRSGVTYVGGGKTEVDGFIYSFKGAISEDDLPGVQALSSKLLLSTGSGGAFACNPPSVLMNRVDVKMTNITPAIGERRAQWELRVFVAAEARNKFEAWLRSQSKDISIGGASDRQAPPAKITPAPLILTTHQHPLFPVTLHRPTNGVVFTHHEPQSSEAKTREQQIIDMIDEFIKIGNEERVPDSNEVVNKYPGLTTVEITRAWNDLNPNGEFKNLNDAQRKTAAIMRLEDFTTYEEPNAVRRALNVLPTKPGPYRGPSS